MGVLGSVVVCGLKLTRRGRIYYIHGEQVKANFDFIGKQLSIDGFSRVMNTLVKVYKLSTCLSTVEGWPS